MTNTMETNTKDWEKEFDEKYYNFELTETISKPTMIRLKDFIRSLLSSHTQGIREKVEKRVREIIKNNVDDVALGEIIAFKEVLQILESNE